MSDTLTVFAARTKAAAAGVRILAVAAPTFDALHELQISFAHLALALRLRAASEGKEVPGDE